MTKNLIIPTAEPFFHPGGRLGCLLVHGFTGTPKEMSWMGDYLSNQGHTVLGIRLAGHATTPKDLARTYWLDWLASVEDGLNILKGCTRDQIVMGLSLGGVLSLIAADRYHVKAVVAMSTPYGLPNDGRIRFAKIMAVLQPKIEKGEDDFHDEEAKKVHVSLAYTPTRSMLQVMAAIKELMAVLPQVKVPTLLVQSRLDKVIPPTSMDKIYKHIGSADKTRLWVEKSGHVVTRDLDREIIFKETSDFIRRVAT